MKPYFDTKERIAALAASADAWKGTPWRANSSACGVGVSCHNLPRALYIETGALPCDFPQIVDTPAQATALNLMEQFLDARPEFKRIVPCTLMQPGDLLGMFIPIDSLGRRIRQSCVNHLGVVLDANQFIHTLLKKNTDIDQFRVPPWSQIILAAWRPLES